MAFLGKHISKIFDQELSSIQKQTLKMGDLVLSQIEKSISTLLNNDVELAEQVIKNDHLVNSLEVKIDEECVKIIAKRQPTASDLRLVLAINKVIVELERIGDCAITISKISKQEFTKEQQDILKGLDAMGNNVITMLKDVLTALETLDINKALQVYKDDKRISQNYKMVIRQHMTFMMEDPKSIPNIMLAFNCAHSILRISARCQNISELIFYYIKGKDFRHASDDQIEALVLSEDQ